jgi:hypothetical protein
MSIGIATFHNEGYKDLAQYTYDGSLIPYAKKHNYKLICKTDNFSNEYSLMFEKIKILLDALNDNPNMDWIWWLDCDAMVTNFNIKLENIIDNDYHIIMTTDINGINCGSFLVKNSPQGKAWLEMIFSQRFVPRYTKHKWQEQAVVMETAKNYTDILKIIPQKVINAYFYKFYSSDEKYGIDRLGMSGDWVLGDFVIHWPGVPNYQRIEWAKLWYENYITKQ